MKIKNSLFIVNIFALWFVSSMLIAKDGIYDPTVSENRIEYDDSFDTPWKEDKFEIKPINNDKLKQVDIDHPPIGFKIYIDESSIAVSESDRVVRYWLVFKSGKSRNAMYEGIRCATSEYKTYGFENKWKKGKVNVNPQAKWQDIPNMGHQLYLYELKRYYFCSDLTPRPLDDIIDILYGYKSTTGEFDPSFHHVQ